MLSVPLNPKITEMYGKSVKTKWRILLLALICIIVLDVGIYVVQGKHIQNAQQGPYSLQKEDIETMRGFTEKTSASRLERKYFTILRDEEEYFPTFLISDLAWGEENGDEFDPDYYYVFMMYFTENEEDPVVLLGRVKETGIDAFLDGNSYIATINNLPFGEKTFVFSQNDVWMPETKEEVKGDEDADFLYNVVMDAFTKGKINSSVVVDINFNKPSLIGYIILLLAEGVILLVLLFIAIKGKTGSIENKLAKRLDPEDMKLFNSEIDHIVHEYKGFGLLKVFCTKSFIFIMPQFSVIPISKISGIGYKGKMIEITFTGPSGKNLKDGLLLSNKVDENALFDYIGEKREGTQ